MPVYKLQLLGKEAQRIASQEIEAADDYEAFEKATELAQDHPIEVWDGRRFIATAEPLQHPQFPTEDTTLIMAPKRAAA